MTDSEFLLKLKEAKDHVRPGYRVLVKGFTHEQLMELAAELRAARNEWVDTCWVNASIYPTFQAISVHEPPQFDPLIPSPFPDSLAGGPLGRLDNMEHWSSHLIFPQQKPIILVVEGFDEFEKRDQYCFSMILGGEYPPTSLHPKSIVIFSAALDTPNKKLDIKGSYGAFYEMQESY